MTLSVVIPAHGRLGLLVRCLTALKRTHQGDSVPFDVCVVDDGSGLDEEAVRKSVDPDYPLTWRSFPEVRGRAAARNESIASTAGDIVVFLDSDMEVHPGFVAAHLDVHSRYPGSAVIGRIIWPDGGSYLRYIGTRGVTKLRPGEYTPPWYFVTGNASVRRADLPAVRQFDESLPGWGGEDLDLGMRLGQRGIMFKYASEAVSFHHFDGDLAGHVARMERYGKDTVPVLVGRYPALMGVLKLDMLKSPFWRFIVRLNVASFVQKIVGMTDRLPLPDAVFDYITFAAYARGWMEGAGS